MKTFYNVYVICGFAAIGGGLFGFDISSMSGVLGTSAYTSYFGVQGSYPQGGITASMPFGSLIGALCSSFIADRYSRKNAIQIASLIWIAGSVLQTAANGIPLLVIGRFISGISVGITSSVVPVYQSEIAPKEIRGRVVSLQQWAITWGILLQYFVQYGSSFIDGGVDNPSQNSAAFRIPWGVQILPAVILLIGMLFFPNSPRWLGAQDRWEEAIEVLAQLHGGGDMNHPKVLAEYREIEEALSFQRLEAKSDFRALLVPSVLKRVLLGCSIQMWAQLSGVNTMMYYVVYVMEAAGIGNALLAASIQYILNVLLTLPAILFLDKWGRRPTLLVGSFLMMALMFAVGALEGIYGHEYHADSGPTAAITWILEDNEPVSRAIVALSYLFVCTFAVTWGPTSWTYPAEIFPNQVRAKAVSLATASNWAWNCVLAFAVPPLLWSISWRMYFIFGAFNGLAFIHMFLTAPETKNKTLEEMDTVFESGRPAWRSGPKGSRLDALQKEIADGKLKIQTPGKPQVSEKSSNPSSSTAFQESPNGTL